MSHFGDSCFAHSRSFGILQSFGRFWYMWNNALLDRNIQCCEGHSLLTSAIQLHSFRDWLDQHLSFHSEPLRWGNGWAFKWSHLLSTYQEKLWDNEAKLRFIFVVIILLSGITGCFGFGASVNYQTHWMGPVFSLGLATMATAFAAPCVFGSVIDAHETLKEEDTND